MKRLRAMGKYWWWRPSSCTAAAAAAAQLRDAELEEKIRFSFLLVVASMSDEMRDMSSWECFASLSPVPHIFTNRIHSGSIASECRGVGGYMEIRYWHDNNIQRSTSSSGKEKLFHLDVMRQEKKKKNVMRGRNKHRRKSEKRMYRRQKWHFV